MALVTFSTPCCNPREHTAKPMTTATTIQNSWPQGSASMELNSAPTASADAPMNLPCALRTMYASIQPATVV